MEQQIQSIPKLHTENYRLREMREEDAEPLYEILSNPTTMRFITPHPVQSIEEMKEKIYTYLQQFKDEKEIPWVIEERSRDQVIGVFRLHKLHFWHQKAELGAIIHPNSQHKGVMKEVLDCILDYAFDELELNRIVGDIFSGNHASRKLLNRFGFQREGVLRQTDFDGKEFHDTEVFSILKSEYNKVKD